jgi:hypothetical protein
MDRLRTYGAVREVSRAIHSEALGEVPRWAIRRGAEQLGMMGKGKVLVFDSEDETDVLAQFLLYEIPQAGRAIILHYLEKRGAARTPTEAELFQGIRSSFSSLFRVEGVKPDGLVLRELFTPGQALHPLIDLGLIRTAKPGLLFFTRLLPLREYAITAGVGFPFAGHHEVFLTTEDLKLRKSGRPDELSKRRYALFHYLSKTIGLPMQYDQPALHVRG